MNRQRQYEMWIDLTAESHTLHSTAAPVKQIKTCMQEAQCHDKLPFTVLCEGLGKGKWPFVDRNFCSVTLLSFQLGFEESTFPDYSR